MNPYFGPSQEETLRRLRNADPSVPITLGDGVPSYVIDHVDDSWRICPLVFDPASAEQVEASTGNDPSAWSWDFLARGDAIFETSSKEEFVRWLEAWPWLGSGVRRSVPVSTAVIEEAELVLEHLAVGQITRFLWSRDPEGPAFETIGVEIDRSGVRSRETLNVPAHLWREFLDVLHESLVADPGQPDLTQPTLSVPDGVRSAPLGEVTVPDRAIDARRFVRCHVQLTTATGCHSRRVHGEAATQVLGVVAELADAFGLDIAI